VPDVEAAAEAFSNAQRAELSHDYARAAEFYELAYGLAASPEALRSAAKNRQAAGHHAIAATHAASLLRLYPESEKSRELAATILDGSSGVLTRVTSECDQPCAISVDGLAVSEERALVHTFYVDAGARTIAAAFEAGSRESTSVSAKADEALAVTFQAPPTPEPEPVVTSPTLPPDRTFDGAPSPATDEPRTRQRLYPAYFGVGLALTAGLGATLAWSGSDVLAQNREFDADPTQARFDAGRSAERRTNALIGATAALGAATIVLAVFTDWTPQGKTQRAARESRVAFAGPLRVRF